MIKKKKMQTNCKLYRFGIGNQHCFLIHHSEVYTFYHYFKDKGLKNVKAWAGFPQHSFEKIKTLIDLGFDSKRKVKYQDVEIEPLEFLTQILKRIKMPKGYKEK